MQIDRRPAADRGVTTLMYVGDDDAVDKATMAPSSKDLLVGAIAVIVALQSNGVTRIAAAGVAGYIGYRAYKARM